MKKFVLIITCVSLINSSYTQNPIDPIQSDMSVAVMNYVDQNNVLKYEKFELGIQLPSDLAGKINNFVNENPNVPDLQKINPYLEWEIRVYAEFMNDSIGIDPIIVDGFYTKQFKSWNVKNLPTPKDGDMYSDHEYNSLGGWNERPTNYSFRVRFAPPKTGEWKTRIKIVVGGKETMASEWLTFNVIESENPGYISIGENRRYLSHNNKTFFPIGCNLPWPESDKINDPQLVDNLSFTDDNGTYYEGNEGYKENFCIPRVYEKYRDVMTQMADNGANYFRMIMYPSATDIEWEKIGNYTKRLAMAQELDSILSLAEAKDLFIHWNMQIHYSFQFSKYAYYRVWAWDSHNDGYPFAYKALINSNNPIDFFSNEEAKKYYKQRLRYILARWGYSTNIGVFEMFSEISNVGSLQADNADFYRSGENWKLSNQWQKEMAAYIKSQYNGKIHLLTASYAGEVAKDDDIFEDPNLDVITSNIYDYQDPSFGEFWTDKGSKRFLNTEYSSPYKTENIKPYIFSESDPIETGCEFNNVEFQRALWQGLFSGLAGSLSWELRKYPQLYPIFGQMKDFISQYDLDEGAWHPGASEQSLVPGQYLWTYNSSFAENMDSKEKKADLSYLRSGDGNYVFGVITNKTYNVLSTSDCRKENVIKIPNILHNPQNVNTRNESLKLRGLNNSRYYISYYTPTSQSDPISLSDDVGPKVKVEYSIPADPNTFITLFVAYRKNYEKKKPVKLENRAGN